MRRAVPPVVYKVEYKNEKGADRAIMLEISPFEHKHDSMRALKEAIFHEILRYRGNHQDGHGTLNTKCTLMVESDETIEVNFE